MRDNWGKDDMENAMHSSDSLENVSRESDICINGDQTSPA
jgi:nucleoside diphosphate kinase